MDINSMTTRELEELKARIQAELERRDAAKA